MTTLSWRGDPQVKAGAVAAMRRHREADRFIRGIYLGYHADKGWVGCFHGCLTSEALAAEVGLTAEQMARGDLTAEAGLCLNAAVSLYCYWQEGERLWGIPSKLGMVLDGAFESFESAQTAGDWAVEVTEAIPVGVDLHPLADQLMREELTLDSGEHGPYDLIARLRKAGEVE